MSLSEGGGLVAVPDSALDLNLRTVHQQTKTNAIQQALIRCEGNISRAAELLGVTRPTLYDLMEKHDIKSSTADETR